MDALMKKLGISKDNVLASVRVKGKSKETTDTPFLKKVRQLMNNTFIETYKVDPGLCDELINYFKNNKEYKHPGSLPAVGIDKSIKDSTDVYFFNSSKDKYINSFLAH